VTLRRALALLALYALVSACHEVGSGADKGAGDAGDAAAPRPASAGLDAAALFPPPPPAILTLLSAGRPPRRKLRYTWRTDQREELTIDLRTVAASAASPSFAPKPASDDDAGDARAPNPGPYIPLAPPVHIVVDVDPTGVGPDEDLRYAWRVVSAGTSPAPGTTAQVAEGMRAEVAAIEHLSGTGHVSSRGMGADVMIDPASLGDSGGTGQMVEQVQQTLREVAAPFPEEEVGLGARWQKISQLAAKDARVTQTETFMLHDLKGNGGTLDDTLAQTAGGPRAIPGAQERIESMLVSASAKTRFDQTRLVPQTRFESTTTMVLSGPTAGDKTGPVTMVLRVEILLAGALR
jgi:hypothetical protein